MHELAGEVDAEQNKVVIGLEPDQFVHYRVAPAVGIEQLQVVGDS